MFGSEFQIPSFSKIHSWNTKNFTLILLWPEWKNCIFGALHPYKISLMKIPITTAIVVSVLNIFLTETPLLYCLPPLMILASLDRISANWPQWTAWLRCLDVFVMITSVTVPTPGINSYHMNHMALYLGVRDPKLQDYSSRCRGREVRTYRKIMRNCGLIG